MMRAPVHPMGWPMEMPEPSGLVFSMSATEFPDAGNGLGGKSLVQVNDSEIRHGKSGVF